MYKTLLKDSKGRPKSSNGRCVWEIGKWKQVKKVKLCDKGFHCSELILDAMSYVTPEFIAEVEVRGKSDIQDDKQAWSEMRLVRLWEWTKEDSVSLAIYGAELCIKNFEKVYPDDKRPRQAIQAAKRYLKNPTEENRSAAESAARSAARSAAWSAGSAAGSAWSAAGSAGSAAYDKSFEDTKKKINKWIIKKLEAKNV